MKEKLKIVMSKEYNTLNDLLKLLDEQHSLCAKKDFFGLENIVTKIEAQKIEIAKVEVERRKLVGNNSMKDFVMKSKDFELENNFRKIKLLIEEINLQKDTNQLLIKQGLVFSNRMLNLLNPGRKANVYNAKGNLYR